MSYDEHLISQAGGDGEPDAITAVSEYVRQRKLLSKDLGPVVHGVFADPEAEMADLTVHHLEALLALVREQQARIERVEAAALIEGTSGEAAKYAAGFNAALEVVREMLGPKP